MRKENIFGELSRMQREIDKMFSSFNSEPSVINLNDELSGDSNFRRAVSDFSENDKEYILDIELPGMRKEDISLNVTDRGIEVKATRKQEDEREDKSGNYMQKKAFAGFYQAIDLPVDADSDNIEAKYDNGILTLRIPKRLVEKNDSKKIEIL